MHVQLRPCLCSQLRDIACLFVLRDFCGEARFDTYTCHLRASWKWPSAGAKDMITRDQQGAQYVDSTLSTLLCLLCSAKCFTVPQKAPFHETGEQRTVLKQRTVADIASPVCAAMITQRHAQCKQESPQIAEPQNS